MTFPTVKFLLFFAIVFLVATPLKSYPKLYKWFLLAVNLFFIFQFGQRNFIILIISIIINFLILKAVNSTRKLRKSIFILGLVLNIAALFIFKFTGFATNTLLFLGVKIPVIEILAPVGISFYTFRVLAHLIDSYKIDLIYQPSFVSYATYVSFFPQVVSGPIQRPHEFYESLRTPENAEYSRGEIITLVLAGMLKKYVLASFLWKFIDDIFSTPQAYNGIELIIGAFAYSSMIYLDFSGYSDFAIAVTKLIGIKIGDNFYYPYCATNLKEFWARWHISLSSFLKDYIYIPLGGNRKGILRKYINILITFFISGLWHGAGITFMIWGILHGIGNILSDWVITLNKSLKSKLFKWLLLIPSWFITYVFVTFAWIFFNSKTIGIAVSYVKNLFDFSTFEISTDQGHLIRIVVIIVFTIIINIFGSFLRKTSIKFFDLRGLIPVAIAGILAYTLIRLGPDLMPPFIYFNF
ncbi:MBOAT family protein [Candidatus Dojkabacteria bacterium]|nr:MBOAT family protein [Candidatus Dojkabacteria bacterium]